MPFTPTVTARLAGGRSTDHAMARRAPTVPCGTDWPLTNALAAAPIVAVVGALPASFVAVVCGLALIGPFQDSLQRSLDGPLRLGALVAFVVAATPFTVAGVGSSSWALLAGVAVSLAAEREGLAASLRERRAPASEAPSAPSAGYISRRRPADAASRAAGAGSP